MFRLKGLHARGIEILNFIKMLVRYMYMLMGLYIRGIGGLKFIYIYDRLE